MSKLRISPDDGCIWINEDATLMIDGDTPQEAMEAAHAINSYDRLQQENAELREAIETINASCIYTYGHGVGKMLTKGDVKSICELLSEEGE